MCLHSTRSLQVCVCMETGHHNLVDAVFYFSVAYADADTCMRRLSFILKKRHNLSRIPMIYEWHICTCTESNCK